ncbi:ArsR/SmtB family transcription factor [Bacteroidota bacterium]
MFSNKELKKLASLFKILSEPSRLKILRSIFAGELCVSEIIKATGLLQANVSKQLKILLQSGIIKCKPVGLQRFYRVVDQDILLICKQICKSKK